MRLPVDVRHRILALGLTAALAGCGLVGGGGGDRPAAIAAAPATAGPAADYPMVLGEPFTVAGELYTPVDTMNYDVVGYAVPDVATARGVTVAHKTLPLPSYVEITSLDSGKTILARVERRGPMSSALVALSPAAADQLGIAGTAPVRLRRVNPPEVERAELRAGRAAPERIETPKSLVEVLRRTLPPNGIAPLSRAAAVDVASARPAPTPVPAPHEANAPTASVQPRAVTAYPLAPLAQAPRARPAPRAPAKPAATASGAFVVQAAAFSSKANADRAAGSLGGFVSPAGRFYRVRTGPYATRGQAEAALAKVRAAGYSDAKVFTAG
jgi:rare lipoprotein A